MVRKMWRDTESDAWGLAKGLWGKSGSSFVEAKKAWGNVDGVWTQFWPPDQTITFNVVATTGEVGYTTSDITWSTDTSVSGTITIQRKAPGGAYVDWLMGQAKTGSSSQVLAPPNTAAGTWSYRAVFIPTNDAYRSYSAEDTVSLTIPSITLTLTQTTGEVYYTSGNFSWTSVTGDVGNVTLWRRKGLAGSWIPLTGEVFIKNGSTVQRLVDAGISQNDTWYYKAIMTTLGGFTVESGLDSAVISYHPKGTLGYAAPWVIQGYTHGNAQDEFNPFKSEMMYHATAHMEVGWGTVDHSEVASAQVTLTGFTGYYLWNNGSGGDSWYSWQAAQDLPSTQVTFSCVKVWFDPADYFEEYPTWQYGFKDSQNRQWNQIVPIGWMHWPNDAIPMSPTWGFGRNDIGNRQVSIAITFNDGQVLTFTYTRYPQDGPQRTYSEG